MECIKKIDWELLKEQKLQLVEMAMNAVPVKQEQLDALDGIINLLDDMQDEYDGVLA
jgi:hypothetical protein